MKVAALVFDKITVLDIVGPMEVMSWLPDTEILWVGKQRGPVRAAPTGLTLNADYALDEIARADVLVIPGGPGVRLLLKDEPVLDWVRRLHATTRWTTSVCTGSLLLGAAGLLRGLEATTHWNSAPVLESFGARYRERRVIPQGKIVTSAGVSSGIDMALWLVGQIAGDEAAAAAQLAVEYDPQPPYDMGAPSKASEAVLERARANVKEIVGKSLAQPPTVQPAAPRFWVIGGEYRDAQFRDLMPGKTVERHGPFASRAEARAKWAALAMATVDSAQTRYHIEREQDAQYWVVGGRYADSSFTRLTGGQDEEQIGPFSSETEALAAWRQKAIESEDDALSQYRVERL
jgi:putative intracellular protease/amidase